MTNPILAFSGKRRMRSIRTPILLTLYSLLLAVLACATIYLPFLRDGFHVTDMRMSVDGYALMLVIQFALIVIIAPAMTAGAISGERERQTLDLLLVTNTGSARIVLGKLLESFGFLALLIVCSTPMLSLVLITGGATFAQVLGGVLFLLVTALAALSVGLFCSSLIKRTVTATVVSYLVILGIGVVTLLPIWYDVKRIGDIYDSMNAAGQTITTINTTPISFILNPALGLFSLLRAQTDAFNTILWGISYTLANTLQYLRFDLYAAYNILFMACASVVLTALSALNLRAQRKGGKGHKKA